MMMIYIRIINSFSLGVPVTTVTCYAREVKKINLLKSKNNSILAVTKPVTKPVTTCNRHYKRNIRNKRNIGGKSL